MSFDGVVFWDFDGTLAARDGMWRVALVQALDEVDPGHRVSSEMIRPGLQTGFPWHDPGAAHVHVVDADGWWTFVRPAILAAYALGDVDDAIAARAADAVRLVYADPGHWSLFPDVREALRATSSAGLRNVILSNHIPELAALVAALGLSDLVDDVITSALVGYEKPHPELFAIALRSVGVATDHAWMVGDNPRADVAGAEAVGIRAILVRSPGGHEDLRGAVDRILDDLGTG